MQYILYKKKGGEEKMEVLCGCNTMNFRVFRRSCL